LLVCTGLLHFKDHKDGAVLFANTANEFSSVQDFLIRYLPTTLVVLYGTLITLIDLDVKRLEPWYQMSDATAETQWPPLLCQYDTSFVLTAIARALCRRYGFHPFTICLTDLTARHWIVVYSSSLLILVTIVVPAVQNSMFITRTEILSYDATIGGQRKLITLEDQTATMNSNFLNTAYSVCWQGQAVPAFTTQDYALAPFTGAARLEQEVSDTTITSQTTKFWTDLQCWPPSSIELNFTTNKTTLDDGRGCIANKMFRFSHFGVALDVGNYEAYYSGGQSIYRDNDSIPGSCPQSPHLILVAWRIVTEAGIPPEYAAGGTAVAMFCEPSYFMQPGEATVAASNGSVLSFVPSGAQQPFSDNLFNRTNFEGIITNGYSVSQGAKANSSDLRVDIADGVSINQDTRLVNAHINSDARVSSAMNGFALGISELSPAQFLEFDNLYDAYFKAHKLLFALAMSHNFEPESTLEQSATYSHALHSVHLVPAFAIATEAILFLVATLCVLLLFTAPSRPLCLFRNPDSLAEIMALSRSNKVQESFSRLSSATEKAIKDAVGLSKFRLSHDERDQPLLIRDDAVKGDNDNTKPQHTPQDGAPEIAKHLPEISWLTSVFIIILIGSSVAAFTTLYFFSRREGGLPMPTDTELVQQLLLNLIPTAFATLLGTYLTLVSRVYAFLRPMEDLHSGHAPAANTLLVHYTSLPPTLLSISAFRVRHYLLALLSVAALLSAVLTVTLASLFLPRDVTVSTLVPLTGLYQPNVVSPYDFIINQSTSINTDSIYPTIANLSASVRLPPWTTSSYGYLPIDLATTIPKQQISDYEFEAIGYGAELDCVDLLQAPADISAAIDFRENGKTFRLLANYSQPNRAGSGSEATGCQYAHQMMDEDGFGAINGELSDATSAFEISNYMRPTNSSSIADQSICQNLTVKGWVRGSLEKLPGAGTGAKEDNFRYNATIISCIPRLMTQKSLLRTNRNGSVLSAKSLGPLNYTLEPTVNLTATLFTTMAATIERATGDWFEQPIWHTDTVARDWSNYVYKKMLNDTALLDASRPVPSFEEASKLISNSFSRLFAVQLSFDSSMLLPLNTSARDVSTWDTSNFPQEAPGSYTIPAKAYYSERRIFISLPNFVISIAILVFDFVVLLLFRLHLREPFLPRMPFTIASQIAFFSGSHVIDDVVKAGGDLKELDRKGFRYGYGKYIGKDGWVHVGIEREPFVTRLYDEGSAPRNWARNGVTSRIWPWSRKHWIPGSVKIGGVEFETLQSQDKGKYEAVETVQERGGNWI